MSLGHETREDIIFAANVLAELYAKYSMKIGPFATQAQVANGRLQSALKRLAPETSDGPTPHHVQYDKTGWLCSVCGGWNRATRMDCCHPHT